MHSHGRYPCQVCAALIMTMLVGCASTTMSTTWKDPSAGVLDMKRVMVVVLNSSPAERRAQEDTLAAHVNRASVVPSYPTLPDELLREVPEAKRRVIASGVDGALVFRLLDTYKESTYVPPSVSTWEGAWYVAPSTVTPGYTLTNTFVRAEISLYEVPGGKLVWAAASETVNPKDARAFALDVIKAAGDELRKQGLLP